jgi:hypothetical protein
VLLCISVTGSSSDTSGLRAATAAANRPPLALTNRQFGTFLKGLQLLLVRNSCRLQPCSLKPQADFGHPSLLRTHG